MAKSKSSLSDCVAPRETAEDKARMKKYQAEDDLRTMQRVEEIKKDKSRVSAMKSLAKEQMEGLKKVTGK